MEDFPKIRPGIEAIPTTHERRDILVLHDRTGISKDLAVDPDSAEILVLLDGNHSLRDIQVALMRKHGLGLISIDDIRGLVHKLDEHHLLDNERYRDHLKDLAKRFRDLLLRPAAHAGHAYPDDPEVLREQLESYFLQPDGPGLQRAREGRRAPIGLIVPHIDFQRGGHCYAWGYSAFPERNETDLYVILGTCHLPMSHLFALTTKDFETPLGRVSCAGDLAEAIVQRADMDLFQDELVHRSEHTIEFQVVFLQYIFANSQDFRILPILCGGFQDMIEKRALPSGYGPYLSGLEAIRAVLEGSEQRTCLIASADLAHLGPQFGDPYPVQTSDLRRIEQDDQTLLRAVMGDDSEGLYRSILAEGDRRRICGLPPIYTLLSLLSPGVIDLLNYGQAFHPQVTVTFASLGFWADNGRT
jgi:AmmeMemoRadiSam system protein B